MGDFVLDKRDFGIWLMWKNSYKTVFDCIFNDLDISDGDFMVLELLMRTAEGRLRQQEMANEMDWTKSRLSHHLSRMQKRGLIMRKPMDNENGVHVRITGEGRRTFDAAVPMLSQNVKRFFIDQLTEQDKTSIMRIAGKVKTMAE
ncbi:MarR family transcriptional regulator [Eubacteriales bacterium OttesenSCG-928-N13]|nr:MarR family transcriptional regulator [Eubacteriales bacterium OttesenSCG-928-N13]